MIKNRGKKQGLQPDAAPKKMQTPKKMIQDTKFFEIRRFERATRAKKQNAIYLTRKVL